MLSNFTMNKIEEDPAAFNDLIWYYEEILGLTFESTDKISEYIDNIYVNGIIIYNDDIKSEKAFIEYFNKKYETNYKSIDEIQDNESIDLIHGDKIYAILW